MKLIFSYEKTRLKDFVQEEADSAGDSQQSLKKQSLCLSSMLS